MMVKLQADVIRVDQAVALLKKIVVADTYIVREKDMVRINTEGKPIWSVTQVLDEYLGLDD